MSAPGSTLISSKEDDRHKRISPGACFKCGETRHWGKKKHPYLIHGQDPVQTVEKQDVGVFTAPLCLDKVGQSLQVPTPQEILLVPLGW